ncbi:hypothetical protein StoSoilB13_20700 [Arthrobacter sp. StoSoilB13]|nr:hypothetical protein StoSoilB13_20700 [Arthrobacter sp. StoSoilB13]
MSTPFATIPDDGTPLRVVVVGAGGMGRAWLRTVEASPLVELVGIVDLDLATASEAAASLGRPDLPVGAGTAALASDVGAQAVINVTVPVAHHPVTTEALAAGLPVLGEKPVASTVAQGLSLAAAAELHGQLFMVSQSRRYNRQLFEAKRLSGSLGPVGIVSAEFFKAPHFGGFRDAMDHPLLLDMAIHQFDMARFLLDADPVSVFCEEYNPSWSWYRGDAGATARLRNDRRGALRVQRKLVQPRSGNLVERLMADQRRARHGLVGRRQRTCFLDACSSGARCFRSGPGNRWLAARLRICSPHWKHSNGPGAPEHHEPGHGGGCHSECLVRGPGFRGCAA